MVEPDGFCSFSAGLLGAGRSGFSGDFGLVEALELPEELVEPECLPVVESDGFCSFSAGLLGAGSSDFSGVSGLVEALELPEELVEPE